jgi:hypothetical protein
MITLTPDQIDRYHRDGFVSLRAVFDQSTINRLRAECRRLWGQVAVVESNPRLQWRRTVEGGKTADRIDPVLDLSPLLRATVADLRLTTPVGQLLCCSGPELFKAKLISKWPGTAGYALHQDYLYWPGVESVAPSSFVTALLALDSAGPDSGPLELLPGLHGSVLPVAPENIRDIDERRVDRSAVVRTALQPGDVVFFHPLTPHRSGPNRSESNRESLFFTYVQPGHTDLMERYYSARPQDFMSPD